MSELEPPLPRKERRAHKRPLPLPQVKFVPAGNPSLPTFVSLMLMITTFMIVLTSISLHENSRMHQLLGSVKQTFALGNADQTAEQVAAAALGNAASGFRTALPMAEVSGESGGDNLMLVMPLAVVIDTTRAEATREMRDAFAALTAGLAKLPTDATYEVELRFADPTMSNAFAGTLADAALKGGIKPARLFVGNEAGDKEKLTLLVSLTLPAQDFVAPAPGPMP